MSTKSPLRYPGGKTRAIKIIQKYVDPTKTTIISPFFGGGSFELSQKSPDKKLVCNDLFEPLCTFWRVLRDEPDKLVEKIKSKIPVTKESFYEMRKRILEEPCELEKAAMYFCLNRTSFSGCTLSGGFSQEASEKRLTESSIKKLRSCDVSGVTFENMDYEEFLNKYPQREKTLVFADPPYYIESYIYGKNGDLHQAFDHERFAREIQKRTDWVLTYNDCEYIRNLYKDKCEIFTENWSYGMNTSKKSSEVVIVPRQKKH
jgi:DNA adenine methylase